MNWLKKIRTRVGAFVGKRKLDAEMDEEMRSHIELRTQANINAGMNPDEARYAASREFGWKESIKETCREQRGVQWIENFFQDVRFGVRMLRKNPGFATVAVVILALGIGVNTAIYSMAVSTLWKPLAFPESDRLVEIGENDPGHYYNLGTSGSEFLDWNANCHSFSDLAAIWYEDLNLGQSAVPERLGGARVTESYFRTLGVTPELGRFFTRDDIAASRKNLVVISDQFWKRHFDRKDAVLGQTLRLNGETYEIIGVASASIRAFAPGGSVWLPLEFSQAALDARGYRTIGRLKPDVSPEQARVEMAVVASRIGKDSPSVHSHLMIDLRQLNERFAGSQTLFRALLVVVGIVMIIACANLAGLLSVRSVHRRAEIGVRAALGASRLRIVRQLLVESLVLSCLAGMAGVLFALWGFDLIVGFLPSSLGVNLAGMGEMTLDWRVVAYACSLSLICGVLFGLVPAIQTSRASLASSLQGSRDAGIGHQARRLSLMFVCAQIAVCFACVSTIGTILLGMASFLDADPGFDSNHLLTFRMTLAGPDFAEDRQRIAFVEQLEQHLSALPWVQSTASADILPFSGEERTSQVYIEGERSRGGRDWRPLVASVTPEYFATMKEFLLRGRLFTRQDDARGVPVTVINENMARDLFGTREDAIGRKVFLREQKRIFEIIGIVRNTYHEMLTPGKPGNAKLYLSQFQDCPADLSVVIRTESGKTMMPTIRKTVSDMNQDLALFDVKTMTERIAEDQQMFRYCAACLALFALLALVMTVVGIHGTIAYSTAQRTREFGVRMALGSTASQLVLLVFRQGLKPIMAGLLLGALGSAGSHAIIHSSDIGVMPLEWRVLAGISVAVMGAMVPVCLLTALRSTKVDPIVALRHE